MGPAEHDEGGSLRHQYQYSVRAKFSYRRGHTAATLEICSNPGEMALTGRGLSVPC
jgi:hypothetical protein